MLENGPTQADWHSGRIQSSPPAAKVKHTLDQENVEVADTIFMPHPSDYREYREREADLASFENRHSGRVQSSPPSVDYSDKQHEEWEYSSVQSKYTLNSSTVDRLRTTLGIIS